MTNSHVIDLRIDRAYRTPIWSAWVKNPQGGGSNATTYGKPTKASLLAESLRSIPVGERFVVRVNGTEVAQGVKRHGCAHGYSYDRGCPVDRLAEAKALIGRRP